MTLTPKNKKQGTTRFRRARLSDLANPGTLDVFYLTIQGSQFQRIPVIFAGCVGNGPTRMYLVRFSGTQARRLGLKMDTPVIDRMFSMTVTCYGHELEVETTNDPHA